MGSSEEMTGEGQAMPRGGVSPHAGVLAGGRGADPGLAGGDIGAHAQVAGLSADPTEAHHCHLCPALVPEQADQRASRVTLVEARRADRSGGSRAKADFREHRDQEGLGAGAGDGGTQGKLFGAPGVQAGASSLICPVGSPAYQLYLPIFFFFFFFEASETQRG